METAFDILLISPEQDLQDELKMLVQLFNVGLESYHLRKPHWGVDETQRFLAAMPSEFLKKIVLHSHFELAKEFGVKGIHLNESNKIRATQLGEYKIISASFHSLEDIEANTFAYEYILLSPIFDSISKVGYGSKFDLKLVAEALEKAKQHNRFIPKIIALGGVSAINIFLLKPAGFSGAALLGAIWQSENPVKAFLEIKEIIKQGVN